MVSGMVQGIDIAFKNMGLRIFIYVSYARIMRNRGQVNKALTVLMPF
jgi:uncharacterized protein (DUF302 family)